MANIIGCVNLSHSPYWNLVPEPHGDEQGARFVEAVNAVRELVRDLQPDAIVVFGPDHARGLFYDVMPPFTIGIEQVHGIGDYETASGALKTLPTLARAVFDGVTRRGFDPAVSLYLSIDHGLAQVYGKLIPDLDVPIIPIVVNSCCSPLPTYARSWAFGQAVGEALREAPGNERVVVVGSGGISHWPNSIDAFDENITPEWRNFLIHGRSEVAEREAARQAKLRYLAENPETGYVNAEWDEAFLERLVADPSVLANLKDGEVEELAGPGAGELRTWAAATAAWGGSIKWADYEPVGSWITGMGVAASHVPPVSGLIRNGIRSAVESA